MNEFSDADVDIVQRWHAETYGVEAYAPGVAELARLVAYTRRHLARERLEEIGRTAKW